MIRVRVSELLDQSLHLELKFLNDCNIDVEITEKSINRPGLALSGFFDHFANERIQIIGNGESAFLASMSREKLHQSLTLFFEHSPLCLVITHAHAPLNDLIEVANKYDVPLLQTSLGTSKFIQLFVDYMDRRLAPRTTMHGVLVEVFGVGILLVGKSGVGKSETALELVERGHRLVADDIVEIVCRGGNRLYGHVSETIEHHMEIRGLGIINIKDLFGAGRVRKNKRIDLIVNIEDWQQNKEYDRLGLEESTVEILNVAISAITIPVRPGRNLPILIETGAKNERLKQMGVHAAKTFNEKLLKMTTGEKQND